MARLTLTLVACVVLLASLSALSAEGPKIRWVSSVNVDALGEHLRHPEGVACAADFFVVADTGNSRLLRYTYGDGSPVAEAEFLLPKSSPIIVQVNSRGDLYFLDSREQSIGILNAAGEKLGTLKPRDMPSRKRLIPKSFKIDGDDNVYILDIFSQRVLVLDPDGRYLRHVDLPEEYGFFSDLAVDRAGKIFLLDGVDAALYSAHPTAEGFSRLGESLKEYMNYPTSLAADETGTLYLVDQFGSGLAVVARDGSFLGRSLGMGWKDSRLYYPSQICISPDRKIVIADRSNSRVQLFTPVGD
jgi:sugar lactone lactonase YvrE